ncbi:hypothetical protein E1B28_013016 [Marasmius oreades]|uniref:HpcH/HpaI aldolase/citrate lyase domain-containing protein n=1 Tax=Marasmius oreades TaxID=181124 RepID=A0A9P7RPE8_9AGAR|nr:uncharacterized protein E1B28_013016 [Marasmius oreades]KAG7087037.1 hypothetical protein E1B28_013016 [Marasmius oreades]
MVQIETKEGIENLEKIAALDGVDTCSRPWASGSWCLQLLLLGPADLSMAYGYPILNPDFHPEVEKLIQHMKDVAHAAGKKWWTFFAVIGNLLTSI